MYKDCDLLQVQATVYNLRCLVDSLISASRNDCKRLPMAGARPVTLIVRSWDKTDAEQLMRASMPPFQRFCAFGTKRV